MSKNVLKAKSGRGQTGRVTAWISLTTRLYSQHGLISGEEWLKKEAKRFQTSGRYAKVVISGKAGALFAAHANLD